MGVQEEKCSGAGYFDIFCYVGGPKNTLDQSDMI